MDMSKRRRRGGSLVDGRVLSHRVEPHETEIMGEYAERAELDGGRRHGAKGNGGPPSVPRERMAVVSRLYRKERSAKGLSSIQAMTAQRKGPEKGSPRGDVAPPPG